MATHSSVLAWRVPMDRGAWQTTVQGVSKSPTQLSDFHFHFSPSETTSVIGFLSTNMYKEMKYLFIREKLIPSYF